MAPNAILSSLLTTVFHQQQHTQHSASSSSPASAEMATSAVMAVNLPQQLRRSPPCFGGQCATVWMAAGNLTTGKGGKQKQQNLKQTPPICPAPASQVELEFSLSPFSSSPTEPINLSICSPGGDFGQIQLNASNPTASFCARTSAHCGHGQWVLRLEDGEEQQIWLDGVGVLHFWVDADKGRLELREREFLRIPGTASCPVQQKKKEGKWQ